MKKNLLIPFIIGNLLLIATLHGFSQTGINTDGTSPDPSAGLDVKFTNRGILPPRMTNAALGAIANPANGLMVYCSDCGPSGTGAMMLYKNGNWVALEANCIPQPVGVSVSASANPVCYGAQVTLTATPVNGGAAPVYQWKVNGINAGTNNAVYTYTPSLLTNDAVTCQVTSSASCVSGNPATSNVVTLVVSLNLNMSFSIWASANPVCASTQVTFNTFTVNAGTNPGYQWKVNGNNAGSGSASFSYTPVNNDVISCVITSNAPCTMGNTATSSITMTVNLPPIAPYPGANAPSANQVVWNWNASWGATGYKWNTTNNYASALDLGATTSQTQTGLTCNTAYTGYAWAYNDCGNSTALTMYQTTSACPVFTCGSSVTINHVAGSVAPVSKTVTYGTVTGIPGEPVKCWITSNLGADHQATSVDDATEASAGWYWQFNRTQGFKHDGMTRTPNTTWIYPISENSDWITTNDPCTIELGTGWRIPTFTEWYNVDDAGGWTNWTGPWNSVLKLHAAGYLGGIDGSLVVRGSGGHYWSSTQNGNSSCWYLDFYSGGANMSNSVKTAGFPSRCVRDF